MLLVNSNEFAELKKVKSNTTSVTVFSSYILQYLEISLLAEFI